jgi:hypothetical protein
MVYTILLAIIGIVTIIIQAPKLKRPKKNMKALILTVLGISSILISVVIELRVYHEKQHNNKTEKYSKNTGTINSGFLVNPSIYWEAAEGSVFKFSSGRFELGKLKDFITATANSSNDSIAAMFKGFDFEAHIEKNKIIVNTTFRDTSGNVFTEIINDNWKVGESNSVWDRNFDDSTFEVKDNFDQIVLQIQIIGNHVKLKCKLNRMDRWVAVVNTLNFPNGPELGYITMIPPGNYKEMVTDPDLKIQPLFMYPSAKYPGVRVN